jgi:hypothetical protein
MRERGKRERERERELEVTLWIVMEIVDKRKRE